MKKVGVASVAICAGKRNKLNLKLSELVAATSGSAIPQWLYDYVRDHREEIAESLRHQGFYLIYGPAGEIITIETEFVQKVN